MTERKFTPFVDDGTMTEYVTRDGREAKVCLESRGKLRGFVKCISGSGEWVSIAWSMWGASLNTLEDHVVDLFDVPVKNTRWVNVYPSGVFYSINTSFPTKEAADSYAAKHRVACIEVTFEEGEGL
jgi:hypothetical protein